MDNFHQLILEQLKEIRRENREEIRNLKREIMEKIELEVKRQTKSVLENIQRKVEQIGEKVGIPTDLASSWNLPSSSENLEQEETIPIKDAILGRWRLLDSSGGCNSAFNYFRNESFEIVEFELNENGGIVYKVEGRNDLIEGNVFDGSQLLYVKNNHLRTDWGEECFTDRYILDGKLHMDMNAGGEIFKRVYEKINLTSSEFIGKWQMAKFENLEVAKLKKVPWLELNETLEFRMVDDGKIQEIENGNPSSVIGRYISDGKLWQINKIDGHRVKEVYRRVPEDEIPIREQILGEWQQLGSVSMDGVFSDSSNVNIVKLELTADGKLALFARLETGEYPKEPVFADLDVDGDSDHSRIVDFDWIYLCTKENCIVYQRIA